MAMMVLLLEQPENEFCLRQEAVPALVRLGVTNVALARDQQTVAVILEGWLFDPIAAAPEAAVAIGTTKSDADASTSHPAGDVRLHPPTGGHQFSPTALEG